MSHNYLNKNRTQELINTIRGHLSDIATVLSNLASGDARDNTKAPINHTQASDTVTSMTGYSKPQSTSAIAATDTLNEAIGKLEKGLDGAGTPNDGVLTIQQNGNIIGTFSANQASNETINIQAISTTMTSSAVGTSDGTATIKEGITNVGITDSISYSNLAIGATYILKTRVYDANTGDYLSITKDGVTSTEISTTITPTANSGVYINTFNIDSVVGIDVGNTIVVDEVLSTVENSIAESTSFLTVIEPVFELGLRVDFVNSVFTRLGDAIGLSGGSDFDNFPMYKRRRCNLADDGTVNAYLGDANYAVDGSNGQVMVEQPKFYYKVVPVTLAPGDNKRLNVVEYWVSNKPLPGYKIHPAFYNTNGNEIDCFYEGAYEGYIYNNKLYSRSSVTPSYKSRANFRYYAHQRGTGWEQETIWSLSANQLLMIIEYGKFNMQNAIGNGNASSSSVLVTGTLNSYGNGTYGTTNSTTAVQWRGKENPWCNMSVWIDGLNFDGLQPYIANTYSFGDNTSTDYTQLSFSIYNASGATYYIRAFGYDSAYDWIFIPIFSDGNANSSVPVGDSFYTSSSGWYVANSGGNRSSGASGGPFNIVANIASSSTVNSAQGGRLLYVG